MLGSHLNFLYADEIYYDAPTLLPLRRAASPSVPTSVHKRGCVTGWIRA